MLDICNTLYLNLSPIWESWKKTNYVKVLKGFVNGKPHTMIKLTENVRNGFDR